MEVGSSIGSSSGVAPPEEAPSVPYADYQAVRTLGRGGSAVATLIEHQETKRKLVAKDIPLTAETNVQSVLTEMRVLKELRHPHIVAYQASYMLNDATLRIVMEYASGGSIASAVLARTQAGAHFATDVVKTWLVQSADALVYVHSQGVLHRDIKPENLLLTAQGAIKLADFGTSRILGSRSAASTVCGTPEYLSPELTKGEAYSQPSDVWALGCVLFELLTLKRAFGWNGSFVELVKAISVCGYDDSALAAAAPHHPEALLALPTRQALLHPEPGGRMTLQHLAARLRQM